LDINFTNQLAVTLSVILAAVLGALVAGSIQFIIEWRRNNDTKRNNQIQARSDLFGSQQAMNMYYSAYTTFMLNSQFDFTRAKQVAYKTLDINKIGELLKDNTQHGLYQYINSQLGATMDKIDKHGVNTEEIKIAIQLGEAKARFWQIIGQIEILFPDKKVNELITEIKKAELEVNGIPQTIFFDLYNIDLEMFINGTDPLSEKRMSLHINNSAKIMNLDSKVNDLVNYLETCLKQK